MLAFRDGIVAAYSATEVTRSGRDGEIGHVLGSKLDRITDCAFLPNHKARAITVGLDGRCRLFDLEAGVTLRTWHAKAPMTSVSVCGSVIAVGRVDGRVDLYDNLGVIQAQRCVGERVINLEWGHGPSPPPILDRPVQHLSDAPSIPPNMDGKAQRSSSAVVNLEGPSRLGLPPALRRPKAVKLSPRTDRRFTVHPDEVDQVRTVRHSPLVIASSLPKPNADLPDVFSPGDPTTRLSKQVFESKNIFTSPHQRPRLSSKTFSHTRLLDPLDSHATSTSSATAKDRMANTKRPRRASNRISPLETPITTRSEQYQERQNAKASAEYLAHLPSPPSLASQNHDHADTIASENILANASNLAPSLNQPPDRFKLANTIQPFQIPPAKPPTVSLLQRKRRRTHIRPGPGQQKAWHPGNVLERESTWPTDSVQDPSLDEDEDDDEEAWQTEDTTANGREAKELQNRRLASLPLRRPPARLTFRSPFQTNDTFSTANRAQKNVLGILEPLRNLDGSTGSSGAFQSAQTHFSPDGWFTPASQDVRELFPRSSSLSPRKVRHEQTTVTDSEQKGGIISRRPNTTALHQANTPWARARAKRIEDDLKKQDLDEGGSRKGNLVHSPTMTCFGCASSAARLASLEREVAKLRDEVAETKIALRQSKILASQRS